MKFSIKTNISLHVHAVSKQFETTAGKLLLFQDLSYTFRPRHTYAITGTSGVGKSTLLHILAGLINPTSGTVYLDGYPLNQLSMREHNLLLNSFFGLLFQLPYLIKELTVLENVMTKGLIAGKDAAACAAEAHELLAVVGLSEKAQERPVTLSGGQQQRVAFARALFGRPQFLLADEPTGDLDPETGKVIVDLIKSCQERWAMGVIVSTHDAYVAQAMDTLLVLNKTGLHEKQAP